MLRFTFHEELGFSTDEMKDLLIKEPKLWLRSKMDWIVLGQGGSE